ncbi:MAG: hypothetical protein QNJ60_01630 [Xenococcaceae cyanobacterium MO_188.B19]|nr:hypothetical protein [Xenococcaceae cyanobacterium MO_188.B19]
MDQTQTKKLINNLPGLVLAIDKMLNKQEKNFGCFQVKKESDFCSLYIPSFPSFKLYQNPRTHVYKGYWQTSDILPDIKDRKHKPHITVKKKQTSVKVKQQGLSESENIKLVPKKEPPKITKSNPMVVIKKRQEVVDSQDNKLTQKPPKLEVIESKTTILVKKQRLYEVVYRYHLNAEIRLINQIIATCLKEKIEASISSVPENEIMPLVSITEDDG